MPRGRPKKEVFDNPDDKFVDIITKIYDFQYDENCNLKLSRNTETVTLEEMAFLKWYQNGCPAGGQISKPGEMKQENKILKKFKYNCNKAGISDEELREYMYVLSNPAKMNVVNKYNNSVDE